MATAPLQWCDQGPASQRACRPGVPRGESLEFVEVDRNGLKFHRAQRAPLQANARGETALDLPGQTGNERLLDLDLVDSGRLRAIQALHEKGPPKRDRFLKRVCIGAPRPAVDYAGPRTSKKTTRTRDRKTGISTVGTIHSLKRRRGAGKAASVVV